MNFIKGIKKGDFYMIKKHWKKLKISLTILTAIVVFCLYLYAGLTGTPLMENNDTITLPTSGVSMPYWLFNFLGYILLPSFCALIMFALLDKIEEKYIY